MTTTLLGKALRAFEDLLYLKSSRKAQQSLEKNVKVFYLKRY